MTDKITSSIELYKLCNKLKDTIRKGPLIWNAKRDRIESVADHVYGTLMLAIVIYYQFGYKLDINKIIYMIAIHELEEIEMGDLAWFEINPEDKIVEGKKATDYILKDFLGKEEISRLLDEFNERKTAEAKFAFHCDKLECDIQIKMYDQEGCFDLNNQANNPLINDPVIKGRLDKAGSLSGAWLSHDKSKYEDDPVFMEINNYLNENDI